MTVATDYEKTDPYLRLKREYKSIKASIGEHTTRGAIKVYLDELKTAIDEVDGDNIQYYLSQLSRWYDVNATNMAIAALGDPLGERIPINYKSFIDSLLEDFKEYDFTKQREKNSLRKKKPGEKKIFLSHSSKDEKYSYAIRDLLIDIGVKEKQLICTSHPLHKIPLGYKIYDYLRDSINSNTLMIILWSDRYLESPACLAEMGAAWGLEIKTINTFIPDFSSSTNSKYHNIPLDQTEMGVVLNGDDNCVVGMSELIEIISDFFNLDVEKNKYAICISRFVKKITKWSKLED